MLNTDTDTDTAPVPAPVGLTPDPTPDPGDELVTDEGAAIAALMATPRTIKDIAKVVFQARDRALLFELGKPTRARAFHESKALADGHASYAARKQVATTSTIAEATGTVSDWSKAVNAVGKLEALGFDNADAKAKTLAGLKAAVIEAAKDK
jgi:hypothetical protein